MKSQQHLIAITTSLPLIAAALILSQLHIVLSPLIVAAMAIGYIVLNVGYALFRKTLQVHTLVEFSLLALIAYFVLTSSV